MSSAHRLIVVGSSRRGFAAIERFMGGDGGAHTAALPSEQVLRWAAGVVGGMRVVSVENASRSTHRPSGTFRVRVEGTSTGATDLILKLSVPRWITDGMVITNARALRLAETHGLAGPLLIAADLDGRASEPWLPWRPSCPAAAISRRWFLPPASGKPEPQSRGLTPSSWRHRQTCRPGAPPTTEPPTAVGAGRRRHPY